MDDRAYLHALYLVPGIGSATIKALLESFETGQAAWEASASDLSSCPGLGLKARENLVQARASLAVSQEWQKITDRGISLIPFGDPSYPGLLSEIPDAPGLLYTRGNYDFSRPHILFSVVGSRHYTDYGKMAIERIVTDLTQAGCTIVSGLAFGIDSLAHRTALHTSGETLAVLGGGIDDPSIAPSSHLRLAHDILHAGALVSEYPPGTRPQPGTFPARNRIIAGLSLGTLVIEAALESGSLITARQALDYNREVFAVPGSIFSPASVGTNRLLREGAKIVTCLDDILTEIPRLARFASHTTSPSAKPAPVLDPTEKAILTALAYDTLHIDKIIKATTLEAPQVASALSLLEIRGLVKNIGGMHYMKLSS